MERAIVTTIRVKASTWRALRALAEDRAERVGGRPSVSAVISEFVEAHTPAPDKRKVRVDA